MTFILPGGCRQLLAVENGGTLSQSGGSFRVNSPAPDIRVGNPASSPCLEFGTPKHTGHRPPGVALAQQKPLLSEAEDTWIPETVGVGSPARGSRWTLAPCCYSQDDGTWPAHSGDRLPGQVSSSRPSRPPCDLIGGPGVTLGRFPSSGTDSLSQVPAWENSLVALLLPADSSVSVCPLPSPGNGQNAVESQDLPEADPEMRL